MNDFLIAFRIHILSGQGGDFDSTILTRQALSLINEVMEKFGAQAIDLENHRLTFAFDMVDKAILAAIEVQQKLDHINENGDLQNLCLASIGIAWKINPFTLQKEEVRSKDLASFIAESASAGEIFLSEGVYDSIKDPKALNCRFTRQLIRVGEEKPLNFYKVFWKQSEVELGMLRKDPNYVDLDIQPIRSFGLKLLASIFLLFFGVLILTIGFDALWTFLVRIMYR